MKEARQKLSDNRRKYYDVYYAYDKYGETPSEIAAMAHNYRSLPVQPTQVYAIIDALLIALLLHAIFMRRKQQGMVFGLVFIFYGVGRFLEEMIRGDNPMDQHIGPYLFTISQMISVYTTFFAVLYLIILYRLPAASPAAVRAVPAEPEKEEAAASK